MKLLSSVMLVCLRSRWVYPLHSCHTTAQRRLMTHGTCYTLNGEALCTEIVKKSKFITNVGPVSSFDEAMLFLERVKDDKANHNCWAYRSATASRCSDDGEPGGTAGRPILSILESERIIDAVVVVTRYFGGIKLGSGGLVRAYGGAAKAGILKAGKGVVVPRIAVKLTVPSEDIGSIYNLLQNSQASQSGASYTKLSESFISTESVEGQEVTETHFTEFVISVPTAHVDAFKLSVASICKGKEQVSIILSSPNE